MWTGRRCDLPEARSKPSLSTHREVTRLYMWPWIVCRSLNCGRVHTLIIPCTVPTHSTRCCWCPAYTSNMLTLTSRNINCILLTDWHWVVRRTCRLIMKVSHTTRLLNRKLVEDLNTFSSIDTNANIQGGIKVPVQLDIFCMGWGINITPSPSLL